MHLLKKMKPDPVFYIRAGIILIPSYLIAFLTEEIFFVVPTIALTLILANSIEIDDETNRNRIDEDAALDSSSIRDSVDSTSGA